MHIEAKAIPLDMFVKLSSTWRIAQSSTTQRIRAGHLWRPRPITLSTQPRTEAETLHADINGVWDENVRTAEEGETLKLTLPNGVTSAVAMLEWA